MEESMVESSPGCQDAEDLARDAQADSRIAKAIAAGRAMEATASASRERQARQANHPYVEVSWLRWSTVWLAGVVSGFGIYWAIGTMHKWMYLAELLHRQPKNFLM
jgi:hypothetical protein